MTKHDERWQVRAPWPDEDVRIKRHFPFSAQLKHARREWRCVIEAGAPERLVGLAILQESAPAAKTGVPSIPEAGVFWDVRPAWRDHAATEALLDAVLAQARVAKLGALVMVTAADESLAALATRRGFVETTRQEVWSVPMATAQPQLEARGSRLTAGGPVQVSPITVADLAHVKKICTLTQLLPPERVFPNGVGRGGGFDPGLSFVVGDPARPAAVLLGREYLGKGYLEVLARDPEVKDLPLSSVIALIREFILEVAALGLDEISCAVRPGTLPGLVPFIRRVGARRMEAVVTLRIVL